MRSVHAAAIALLAVFIITAVPLVSDNNAAADAAVSLADIGGVTAPAAGATPVTTITETSEYTGTVVWSPTVAGTFGYATIYTATITLTPKAGFTLTGVTANFFTVAGATPVTNAADSGIITAEFPKTEDQTISISAIPGVTVPAAGATPVTTITETAEYTGTVVWNPAGTTFGYATLYTATITITPKAGYTLNGVGADFFTVAGADTVSNAANSGIITAEFPNTADAPVNITVSGRVVTGFDLEGLEGVTVTMITAGGVFSCLTDADGAYRFLNLFQADITAVPSETFTIRFDMRGHLVQAFFLNGELLGWNDVYIIEIDDAAIELPDVIMNDAFGTIEGKVTFNGRPISGVTVIVYDPESGEATMKSTNWEGFFSFSLPVGSNYQLSVSHPYYEAPETELFLANIEPVVINFELTQKEAATYLFGLDFTHSMMIIAGIIGLFLFIFVISYRIHIGKHPEASKVHYDSKKKDQE